MKKWQDRKLGEFTFSGIAWEKDIILEAFSAFSYDSINPSKSRSNQFVRLSIEVGGEDELPSEEVINQLHLTLENHERLVSQCIDDLFNEILGKGPDTWMWWNSGIEDIREFHLESKSTPSKSYVLNEPNNLYDVLGTQEFFFKNVQIIMINLALQSVLKLFLKKSMGLVF